MRCCRNPRCRNRRRNRRQSRPQSRQSDRESAEHKQFNSALVESIAQITGEVSKGNPDARFSKVFQEEYKGMSTFELSAEEVAAISKAGSESPRRLFWTQCAPMCQADPRLEP